MWKMIFMIFSRWSHAKFIFPRFLLKFWEDSETRTSKTYLWVIVFNKMYSCFHPFAQKGRNSWNFLIFSENCSIFARIADFLRKCDFSRTCAPGLIKPMRNGCFLGDSGVKSCILAKKCIISWKKWLFHEKSTFSRKNMIWARFTSVHSKKSIRKPKESLVFGHQGAKSLNFPRNSAFSWNFSFWEGNELISWKKLEFREIPCFLHHSAPLSKKDSYYNAFS